MAVLWQREAKIIVIVSYWQKVIENYDCDKIQLVNIN